MAELKTHPGDASVDRFLNGIDDEERRADCRAVLRLMERVTGEPPRMWGVRASVAHMRETYPSAR